ncbi:unnamed protein product [Parajaminaea phylloscopi]
MVATADPLTLSLDLLRRLPPSNISRNLDLLVNLCPALADDLYSSVDQPLRVRVDKSAQGAQREYLACDYNRDGDSWRSPWSNEYDPPLDDGTKPSRQLRELEVRMGTAMEAYRQLYYDTGLSSVYLWDLDDGAFAGVVLFKKELNPSSSASSSSAARPTGTFGSWDSLHVFEATPDRSGRSASYKLTSTVMLSLGKRSQPGGADNDSQQQQFELAGSLTRQAETESALGFKGTGTSGSGSGGDGAGASSNASSGVEASHIANLGSLIEDMESKMRNQILDVYFGKTKDVLGMVRSTESLETMRREQDLRRELMGLWKR